MPRPDVSEERREQILDAAMSVFVKKGINGTRMDDIVKASGLSKGALYWYFDSKTTLIQALLNRIFEQDLHELMILVQANGSAIERLNEHMKNSINLLIEMSAIAPLVFEFYGEAARNQDFKEAVTQYLELYREPISKIIQQGIDSGEFAEVNALTATISISAMIEGTFLHFAINPEDFDLVRQLEFGYHLFLQGLKHADSDEINSSLK